MNTEKENDEKEEKKEFKVITGDGSDLDISPVYDHINSDTPQSNQKKENIVIPKGTNTKK